MLLKKIFNKLGIYRVYTYSNGLFSARVPVFGDKGFVNLTDAEPWMTDLLSILGREFTSLADIGANLGQTLIKWKGQYPKNAYVGFEPNNHCNDYLDRLIRENKFTASMIHAFAIARKAENRPLYLPSKSTTDSAASLIADFRKNQNTLTVNIASRPFKDFEINTIDLIKIDVEGFELEVIESIFETDLRCPIICEVLPVYTAENKKRLQLQGELEMLLSRNSYSLFQIIKTPNVGLKKMETIGIHGNMDLCDYLFIPDEKMERILSLFNQ